jgi:transcriptional regulator with XRE-family HTH domain
MPRNPVALGPSEGSGTGTSPGVEDVDQSSGDDSPPRSGILPPLAELGNRIRRARLELRLTLKQLEEACGLSATHLSEIERGKTSPTVGALTRMARALRKEPAFFIELDERADAARCPQGAAAGVEVSRGVTAEALSPGIPGGTVYAYRLRLRSGARISFDRTEVAGDAIVYLTRGEAEVTVGERCERLTAGDAIHTSSRSPHLIRGLSQEPAELIAILTRPIGESA